MARSLAGPAQGGRRPGLEGGGPKTGKVATNPGVGSGPNLGTTRSWSNAARKLEKRGSRQRPAAADDWKNQYLSIISIVLKTACPSTPRSAAPGCLFCRRPLTRRPTGCPAGRRRLPGPPVSTGCSLRSLLPVGLSGAPPRRRRPAASRGHRFRLVAPPVAAASAGCCAGLFFPPAIPIDPPVSPFAGPPRRTGGVCLPFGRNGGRKCRSRLEYCAEFPSFVTPKHQYHEKPPPRTLCVCGLLQCSAGRMLRA